MTVKNARTILFASLIAAMVLPFSGGAVSAEDQQANDEKMAKYIQELEKLRQDALDGDKIPDSKLAERYGEKWISQYPSAAKFRESFDAIKQYSQHQYQQNGWNEKMVKTHNAVSNFDTMIEKDGFGHEIVSLVVAKQKLQDQYSATEPAAKFHDWVGLKYLAPETAEQIDARLLEIVGSGHFLRFADDIAAKFNSMAEHGNVPEDLFDQDPRYWNVIVNISTCRYDKTCDLDSMKGILESKAYERDAGDMPEVASGWLSLFLPNAYAWSPTHHSTAVYGEPFTCTYGNCRITEYVPVSIGEHNVTAQPPETGGSEGTGHGTSNDMDIHVSTCSNEDGYNVVYATVTIGSVEYNSHHASFGCTILEATIEASDRTHPSYVWYVSGTTHSWNQ